MRLQRMKQPSLQDVIPEYVRRESIIRTWMPILRGMTENGRPRFWELMDLRRQDLGIAELLLLNAVPHWDHVRVREEEKPGFR